MCATAISAPATAAGATYEWQPRTARRWKGGTYRVGCTGLGAMLWPCCQQPCWWVCTQCTSGVARRCALDGGVRQQRVAYTAQQGGWPAGPAEQVWLRCCTVLGWCDKRRALLCQKVPAVWASWRQRGAVTGLLPAAVVWSCSTAGALLTSAKGLLCNRHVCRLCHVHHSDAWELVSEVWLLLGEHACGRRLCLAHHLAGWSAWWSLLYSVCSLGFDRAGSAAAGWGITAALSWQLSAGWLCRF